MKTQILTIALVLVASVQSFAGSRLFSPSTEVAHRCDKVDGANIGAELGCLETSQQYLIKLNDQRMQVLVADKDLKAHDLQDLMKNVTTLRAATEARKNIYCSLRNAASPFGGGGQALANRECALDQELTLEKELIEIKGIAAQTVKAQDSW